jgi:hypothetical protein
MCPHKPIVCVPRPVLDGVYACVAAARMQKRSRRERTAAMLCPLDCDDTTAPFEDALAIWAPMDPGSRLSLHRQTIRDSLRTPASLHPFSSNLPLPPPLAPTASDRDCEKIIITAIACVHSTADVGYIISEQREKLRDEFVGRPGKELGELRKQGIELSRPYEAPLLAYVCDTTAAVFANAHSSAAILACPVVMIECNYLETEMEDEANQRGHMCWTQLAPIVAQYPNTLWILFHFSQRYRSNADIKAFFAAQPAEYRPANVRLWLAGEVAALGGTCASALASACPISPFHPAR